MLLDAWRLALGTLTALPVRPPRVVDPARARLAMVLAPVAALPLGLAVVAVVLLGEELRVSPLVVALLAIGVVVLGNRGFHLDGLSDVADGLAASYDRERSLAVMKSGTSGPAGVVAVFLVLGLQVAGLAGTSAVLAGAAVCLSRAALVVCCVRGVPPARADGIGRSFTQTAPPVLALGVWLVVGVLLALADGWRGALAAAVALLVVVIVVWRAVRRFGGVTGDVFGASVEVALAAMLVTLS